MMKSPSFAASGALVIVSLAIGCNAILGTTPGKPEGAGGGGGASSSVGGGGSAVIAVASAASSGGTGGASNASSNVAASSSANASSSSAGGSDGTSTSSGGCNTDEDGDGAISWQCPGGTDCADQDARAHPGAAFFTGPSIMGARSPGTLSYDFDCDQKETMEWPKLVCNGASCATPPQTQGFNSAEVACGNSGMLGHCAGLPCSWVSDSGTVLQSCK
jgi:hypothetical protein